MEIVMRCKLAEVMKVRGLNQGQLSEKAKVSTNAIGKMAANKSARFDVEAVNKIATALGITDISELFELTVEGKRR